MKLRRAAAAAACLIALAMPAAAGAADPLPPGAAISNNSSTWTAKQVPRASPRASSTVNGKDILVVTGRFGFKTYDVSDAANPVLLNTFMPAGIATRLDSAGRATGRTRTWSSTRSAT